MAPLSTVPTAAHSAETSTSTSTFTSTSASNLPSHKMKTGLLPNETICIIRDVEMKTRDNVILRGDVYFPFDQIQLFDIISTKIYPDLQSRVQSGEKPNSIIFKNQNVSLVESYKSTHRLLKYNNASTSVNNANTTPITAIILHYQQIPRQTLEEYFPFIFTQESKTTSSTTTTTAANTTNRSYTTVLIRTPYDKNTPTNRASGLYWSQSGYISFIQDCRGRFASDGTFYKYTAEMNDGYDTVEWIATQPWSNGHIIGDGKSYLTHTQMTLSLARPPHWSGSFAYMGGFWNAYTSGIRQGGVYETRQLVWAYKKAPRPSKEINEYMESINLATWLLNAYPWKKRENFLAHAPSFQQFVYDQTCNTKYTTFWEQIGFNTEKHIDKFSNAPALFLAGWYDIYARSTIEFFMGLTTGSNNNNNIRLLVMGPWTHTGGTNSRVAGDIDLGIYASIQNVWTDIRRHAYHYITDYSLQHDQGQGQGELLSNTLSYPVHPHYDFVRTWYDLIVPRNQPQTQTPRGKNENHTESMKKTNTTPISPLLKSAVDIVPPVTYFRMGLSSTISKSIPFFNSNQQLYHGGNWFYAKKWPLQATTYTPFKLSTSTLTPYHAGLSTSFGSSGSSTSSRLSHLSNSIGEKHIHDIVNILIKNPASIISSKLIRDYMKREMETLHQRVRDSPSSRNRYSYGPAPRGLLPWVYDDHDEAEVDTKNGGVIDNNNNDDDVNPHTDISVYQYDPNTPSPSIGGNVFPHLSEMKDPEKITRKGKNTGVNTGKVSSAPITSLTTTTTTTTTEILLAGGYDQIDRPQHVATLMEGLPLSARRDTLCFATEPLDKDVEVTGTIHVLLYVSSDCVDTDFAIKVIDEYPTFILPNGQNTTDVTRYRIIDSVHKTSSIGLTGSYESDDMSTSILSLKHIDQLGNKLDGKLGEELHTKSMPRGYDLNVSHGIQRVRYRYENAVEAEADDTKNIKNNKDMSQDSDYKYIMKPNNIYLVHIELYPTSNLFQKGHRIRIDISSSNFPHFDVNPNTKEGSIHSQRKIIANNAIFHSKQFPSTVVLPIIRSTGNGDDQNITMNFVPSKL